MLTEKELAERMSGIGSADAAAVLGCHKYKSADQVLQEKLGHVYPADDRLIECGLWGDFHEPNIIKVASQRLGYPVKKPKKMIRHPDHTFMIAHLDGVIEKPGCYGILECKSMRYPTKEFTENRPEDHYYSLQLHHQMAVGGHLWGVLAILFGGNELKLFEIKRDDELIAAMIEKEREFWETVLNARKEQAA